MSHARKVDVKTDDARQSRATPVVATVAMGYGHLRAAVAVADGLGTEVSCVDRGAWVRPVERLTWAAARRLYETLSRLSQAPRIGRPFATLLDSLTTIPPMEPGRTMKPSVAVRLLDGLIRRGLGATLATRLTHDERSLISTFYVPALAANRHTDVPVACVVTDTDINPVWVPIDPATSRVTYLAPTEGAEQRLLAYGVPEHRIRLTGFPLPLELLGGPDEAGARSALASRLSRLDPGGLVSKELPIDTPTRQDGRELPHEPVSVVVAVGGAGAQTEAARRLPTALADVVKSGRIRLTMVAGTRSDVARRLRSAIDEAGLSHEISVLFEPDFTSYYRAFNQLLRSADILWTKPSELVFYAALGLPLMLTPPVGAHEHANRRWILDNGAGFDVAGHADPRRRLDELLAEGRFAAAAWNGWTRLPRDGTRRIAEAMAEEASAPSRRVPARADGGPEPQSGPE